MALSMAASGSETQRDKKGDSQNRHSEEERNKFKGGSRIRTRETKNTAV